jgi:hypothetical protein
MTVTGSIGLLAPAGTPTGIIERIAQATCKAVAEPAYKQMLIDAGMEATLSTQTPKNSDIPSQPMLLSGRQSSRRHGALLPSALGAFMALYGTEPDLNAGRHTVGRPAHRSSPGSEAVRAAGGPPRPGYSPALCAGSFSQPTKVGLKNWKGAATRELNLNARRRMSGRLTDYPPFRNRPGHASTPRGPQSREDAFHADHTIFGQFQI